MKTTKYFSATWCGPCKIFKPVMQELASEGNNIQFIDVDENNELASKYGIRSVPTVVVEEGGVEVDRFVGVLPKNKVMERIS